jgi:hypothetical protein
VTPAKGKGGTGLTAAVEGFVSDLELEGAEDVLGRLAVDLAQALEEAPGYSKARLARELRETIAGLERRADELEDLRARRAQRQQPIVRVPVEGGG